MLPQFPSGISKTVFLGRETSATLTVRTEGDVGGRNAPPDSRLDLPSLAVD